MSWCKGAPRRYSVRRCTYQVIPTLNFVSTMVLLFKNYNNNNVKSIVILEWMRCKNDDLAFCCVDDRCPSRNRDSITWLKHVPLPYYPCRQRINHEKTILSCICNNIEAHLQETTQRGLYVGEWQTYLDDSSRLKTEALPKKKSSDGSPSKMGCKTSPVKFPLWCSYQSH